MPFPVLECPFFIRTVADGFKDLVGNHYREFVSSLCGAVLGISGFCNLHRFLPFTRSVSSMSRFLSRDGMEKKLNRRHRRRVLRLLSDILRHPKSYLWAVDDTIVPRRGEKIWGSYRWYNHTTLSFTDGHKLLVIGIVDKKRKLFIPVIWEVMHLKAESSEYQKETEVVLRLLDEVHQFGFPKLTVVADSWFGGEILYEGLSSRGLTYVLELRKKNRILATAQGRTVKDLHCDELLHAKRRHPIRYGNKKRFATEAIVRFKRSSVTQKAVAVFNHRQLDQKAYAIYVTNRLTWNASTVWGISRDRWAIEVHFRELRVLRAECGH